MLILLPPSEGKTAPRRGHPIRPDTWPEALRAPRTAVVDALMALCADDPERAMATLGLGPTQADDVRCNAALGSAPTAAAGRVYSGVLYDALDVEGLSPAAKRRATRWVAVVSALYGVVRLDERLPAYRLGGGVTLPGLGTVAGHWRTHLDPVVRELAGTGLVVDLRSSTYTAFWRPATDLAPRVVTVRVLHEVGGRRQVVSHFNKATKGRLVRDLLEDGRRPRTPAAFANLLGDLGWKVEREGTRLDVIVSEI